MVVSVQEARRWKLGGTVLKEAGIVLRRQFSPWRRSVIFTVLETVSDRYSIVCQKVITVSLCLQDCDRC